MGALEIEGAAFLDCFNPADNFPWPEHLCCDAEQWPPKGFWKCWGGPYTYESCCRRPPSCTERVISEVWNFVGPDSDRSYRDFWKSNTFYEISRVRKDPKCQIPFVARSVLAFTKFEWEQQWEVLHFPRRARDHHNWQLRRVVDAMWMMIEDIPLEDFLKSGKWAEMILKRLYGHSKKTAYYLLSDGMPLLSGRLPLSDAGMTPEDEEFQQLLRRRLNLKLPLPLADAQSYLARPKAQAFGLIAAHLVVATVLEAQRPQAIAAAQELLRSWVEKNDYADLFFSHWPIYRLMLYLQRDLSASTERIAVSSKAWEDSGEMLVISCHPPSEFWPPLSGWRHALGCRGPWSQLLSGSRSRWVLLISDFAQWTAGSAGSVREALTLAEDVPVSMAVGLPTTDQDGTWQWPVRRLEFLEEAVRFGAYPTGYAGSQGRCCRGDTTSGTRAYHWDTMKTLFEEVDRLGGADTMRALLVRLDILNRLQLGSGRAAATCMVPPLMEDDYAGLPAQPVHHNNLPSEWRPKLQQLGHRSLPSTWHLEEFVQSQIEDKVLVLYCGPLDLRPHLQQSERFLGLIFQEPLEKCAQRLRSATSQLSSEFGDAWVLFLSPFAVDGMAVDATFVEVLRSALLSSNATLAAGSVVQGEDGKEWRARSIRYRFYKLQYRPQVLKEPSLREGTCVLADTSSGTRLYKPGIFPALMKKTVTSDMGTFMVELDLLLKLGPGFHGSGSDPARHGRIWTCAGPALLREEDYLQTAQLPVSFSKFFQVEAADYGTGRILLSAEPAFVVGNGTDWMQAHEAADRRMATSLLYRRRIEDEFVKIVQWWTSLDPERHFAAPKQGTLLTAMVRGGDVSMMPWDTDLELALYSTGPNPVLGWCDYILTLKDRRSCVLQELQEQLQMPVMEGPDQFFSEWIYNTHLTFAKFRVAVDYVFDVNFESYVPFFPIKVRLFGDTLLRVSWPAWEHLFFEVFQGSFEKKVGTSGTILSSVKRCRSVDNACMPDCEQSEGPCDFEFEDYFAHSRDPQGRFFPD